MGVPAFRGVKIHDVFVTPGCYKHYTSLTSVTSIQQIDTNQKVLHSLYTSWGLAVAACVAGDTPRAIKLKPTTKPNTELEKFAQKFVAYHEGCYYLQQLKWRESINPLKQVKSEVQASQEWQKEIDRLCGLQRQNISEQAEHLACAEFWYEIANSLNARSYLAQYKAEQIREKVVNEQISKQEAIKELEKIKQIDPDNPVVISLIQQIKIAQSAEVIDNYLDKNDLKGAVDFAKNSSYPTVKNMVAKICIDIFVDGFKTRKIGFEQLYDLGRWTYELCPDDKIVKEIYEMSKDINEIKKLINLDRCEEAIRRAKSSEYDALRFYVGDYFMTVLIQGIQKEKLPVHLVHKVCRWVYELCPDAPGYQEIYRQFNIC